MSGNKARLQAINETTNSEPKSCTMTDPQSKIWACDVFNLATMEEALSH